MSNNLKLEDIKSFVTIGNYGSFTKAAQALGVSRGHLSKQLKNLESELSVQLVIRTTRSLSLTADGHKFYRRCKEALGGIAGAVEEVLDNSEEMKGKILINCVGGIIGEDIIAPLLADFAALHREVELEIDFNSSRVDLVKDKYDLIVRLGKLEDSEFMARGLGFACMSVLASKDYLSSAPALDCPKDLKKHNCLTGSISTWSFTNRKNQKTIKEVSVSGKYSCKNGRALKNAALKGLGVVRLPEVYCREAVASGVLVEVLDKWAPYRVPIHLLYYDKQYMPARLKGLVDFLHERFTLDFKD